MLKKHMISAQLVIFTLMLLVILGTFVNPPLREFGTQLMALLLLFYLLLDRIGKRQRRSEVVKRVQDEETLLFLSTYLKPKMEDLIDLVEREENQDLVKKQLQLTEREVNRFLEDKEKEAEKS